jgi:hypothetical protein
MTVQAAASVQPSHDVFLSYRRADTSVMITLRDALRLEALNVWTDEALIPGTPSWKGGIEYGIEHARCLVLLLSERSIESTWVRRELLYAKLFGKRIFAICFQGTQAETVNQFLNLLQPLEYTVEIATLDQGDAGVDALVTMIYSYLRGNQTVQTPARLVNSAFRLPWLMLWNPNRYLVERRKDTTSTEFVSRAWAMIHLTVWLPWLMFCLYLLFYAPAFGICGGAVALALAVVTGMFTQRSAVNLALLKQKRARAAENGTLSFGMTDVTAGLAGLLLGIAAALTIITFAFLPLGYLLLEQFRSSDALTSIRGLSAIDSPFPLILMGGSILVVYGTVTAILNQMLRTPNIQSIGYNVGLYGGIFVIGRFGSDISAAIGWAQWVFNPAVITLAALFLTWLIITAIGSPIQRSLRRRRSKWYLKAWYLVYVISAFGLLIAPLILNSAFGN